MKRADVVSVRNLFAGASRYRCGPARPGFHWGPSQVAQLIVDLENAAHESHDAEDVPEEALYLGVVTVSPADGGQYVLLDGQQRFIVLAMFLAFARDRVVSNGERNMLDRLLVRRAFGRRPEPRFRLTPEDHAWFAHFILPPGATKRLPATAPLGSPRELLLAARFMEHTFAGYTAEHLRSIVDFLLHHTAMVRSLAHEHQPQQTSAQQSPPQPQARLAAPPSPPPSTAPSLPHWNDQDTVPTARYRVAAE